MNRENFSKITLLFLIGTIMGILIAQFVIPGLENLFFSRIKSKEMSVLPVAPQIKKKAEIPCQTSEKGKTVEVDLSTQKLKMCENGKAIKEISISSGKPETPTPKGNFRVINKSLMVYSKLAHCWLPFWVGFSQDGKYGFHEVPICAEGDGRTSLPGQPVSLGCIRLDTGNAETFYKWVDIETKVIIY